MNISRRHSNSNFSHSFEFSLPYQFCKKILICRRWSLSWCELLCINKPWRVIMDNNIWWAKFELIYFLIYWYSFSSIQNSKSLAKTQTFNACTSELKPKKNHQKFLTLSPYIHHFSLFSLKYFNCHHEYFGVYFSWWNHLMLFKMVHFNTKNAKCRVCKSQVKALLLTRRTTHSSVLNKDDSHPEIKCHPLPRGLTAL